MFDIRTALLLLRTPRISDAERLFALFANGEVVRWLGAPPWPYPLGQPYWGHGYMSEAARGFIAHVFATIADDTLYSGAFSDNAASLHIQDKLGFRRDGTGAFYSRPHAKDIHQVNTSLARAEFAAAG